MEISPAPKRPTVIKYSLITSALLIVYFLILVLSGLIRYSGLRMINYALIAVGLYMAFKEIRGKNHPHLITYLGGLGMGFMILLITDIIFSFFVLFYGLNSPSFINAIWKNPFFYNTTANSAAMSAYIFSETLFLGVILDLIVILLFTRQQP